MKLISSFYFLLNVCLFFDLLLSSQHFPHVCIISWVWLILWRQYNIIASNNSVSIILLPPGCIFYEDFVFLVCSQAYDETPFVPWLTVHRFWWTFWWYATNVPSETNRGHSHVCSHTTGAPNGTFFCFMHHLELISFSTQVSSLPTAPAFDQFQLNFFNHIIPNYYFPFSQFALI